MPKILLALLIAMLCGAAHALMLSPQSGLSEPVTLSGELSALRDASGRLSIDEVAVPQRAGEFAALPGFLSAGYGADTYWLRFTLQRRPDAFDHWFLEVGLPFLDEVTLYAPRSADGGSMKSAAHEARQFDAIHLGDRQPYAERPVPHRHFVFPVRLVDDRPVTFYLRIKTTSTMLVRVFVAQYAGLLARAQVDTALYASYFGVVALGVLANLVFWAWLRAHVYLSYSFYLATLGALMFANGGFAAQWMFPNRPLTADQMVGVMVGLTYLSGFAFFIEVLQLRKHFPRFDRAMDAILIFYAACGLAATAGYYGSIVMPLQIVAIAGTTALFVSGPWLLWRGHRQYLLYVLALGVHFAGIVFVLARYLGWVDVDVSSDYSNMLTSGLHIVLLNFAVADRVRSAEREKLEAEKRTAELAAEHDAVMEQRQFVAMVSHEFRTPLAVIDATAQSVEIACSQATCGIRDSIVGRQEKIRRAVRRLVSLLDNYLTGERLEVRDAELKREVLDLRDLASATVESWHHLMQTPDQLQLEPGGGGASAIADRAMMELALSNLIDNALKYSPPGGSITLRVGTSGGDGWIEVVDSGVGIAPDEIETIFDKFYRGGGAQTVPGAGLGLHLVRRIVREHGGEVGVISQPGKGSRFRVRLPLAERSGFSAGR